VLEPVTNQSSNILSVIQGLSSIPTTLGLPPIQGNINDLTHQENNSLPAFLTIATEGSTLVVTLEKILLKIALKSVKNAKDLKGALKIVESAEVALSVL
jgi:hypothetical protein